MARHQSSSNPRAPRNVKKHEKAKPIKTESTLVVSNANDHSRFSVEEQCDLIAQLSESVLEDPSTAFFSTQEHDSEEKIPSKMSQLLALARQQDSANDEYVARLACISLLALFQDVLPSYRIRLPTAAEMAVRVSKETKQLWDYERALLSHYQLYLKLLEQTFDKHKKSTTTISTLQTTAILSLCELCKSSFSFNFGNNVLKCVVRQMNLKKCEEIRTAACRAVAHLFQHDAQGTCALEATRLVAKMVKDVRYRVEPQVLQTFTSLPLRIHLDEAEAAKLAAAANAKKRKRNRQEAEIESELKEASSSVDKIILARAQSDTLQAVTLTYFAILKSERLHTDVSMRRLLPTVLEGLAKFAHFIHFDTVLDLLQVFQTLLQRVDELSLEASLQCILTAFSILQGPGRELKIDQKEYITPLYSQLPRLVTEGNATRNHTDLMLQCLNAAFIKRREYSTVRIAAFMKQICTVALHAPCPSTAAPLFAFVRQLSQRYPSVHQMMESEQDVITSGTYNPNVLDPEHSNPFATCAWELSLAKFHPSPRVARQAADAACLKMLQLPLEAPERMRRELLQDASEFYVATRRASKKHPLLAKQENSSSSSSHKRQRQERFITANKTANYHLL